MTPTFGRDAESVPHWEAEAARYTEHIEGSRAAYHEGRLETAARLLERANLAPGAHVVDFGCGEGVFGRRLAADGFAVTGLDPAEGMIELARERDPERRLTLDVGGAEALAAVGRADAVVALNVLAYMTNAEMTTFWAALEQILAPRGALLVSHSNELFDLFALNSGTAAFFAEHFTGGKAVDELLPAAGTPATYNVRANPLTYAEELAAHGLEELGRAYFNFHPLPPALLGEGDAGRIVDPDAIARVPEWKQQFQCSTLFSLSQRRDPERDA
jgi:2-polyprenyl-3-methyl-5-hydroxy-6-metoxy-1,4-benzoquinol methylase